MEAILGYTVTSRLPLATGELVTKHNSEGILPQSGIGVSPPPRSGTEPFSILAAPGCPWLTGLFSFCLCRYRSVSTFFFSKRHSLLARCPPCPYTTSLELITPPPPALIPNKVMPGGSGVRAGTHLGDTVRWHSICVLYWASFERYSHYLIN